MFDMLIIVWYFTRSALHEQLKTKKLLLLLQVDLIYYMQRVSIVLYFCNVICLNPMRTLVNFLLAFVTIVF